MIALDHPRTTALVLAGAAVVLFTVAHLHDPKETA